MFTGVIDLELGEKIRAARLEKGLSQRRLCADTITRNMLSQIENGSAKPSMSTLQALASRLDKPLAYFLDEEAVTFPNASIIARARSTAPEDALELLRDYRENDPVFDAERWLLEALCCLRLAEAAIREGRNAYAIRLLSRAAQAGGRTAYYTEDLERRRLLLAYAAEPENAQALAPHLPDLTRELLLRGQAALTAGDPRRCLAILGAAESRTPHVCFFMGKAYLAIGDYDAAAKQLRIAEADLGGAVYPLLEQCYRELGDFKQAYEYACKQR